jgi:hypothetical protein
VLIYQLSSRTLAMPPLEAGGGAVTGVTWKPDGSVLAGAIRPSSPTSFQNGRIDLWLLKDTDWTSQICRWTGGGLSPDEWKRYVEPDIPYINLCEGVGE